MLLLELFDNGADWNIKEDVEGYEASFETPDGVRYIVDITTSNGKLYSVSFHAVNDEEDDVDDVYAKNNRGNEFLVMSTVLDIILNVAAKHPDSVLQFTSTEENRSALYRRMLKRFVKPPYAFVEEGNHMKGFYVGHQDALKAMLGEYEDDE